ncbi:DUF16 domain-containing protein [Mycoplasmoides pneumoniae]|uniref:UPF0134 protein MPN_038 n=4 Tax=Mycoplasmoides pneumoniae TaxID=2104 RepID=Y038_MYCPN|nr:DUF16 domain-containing protein [Mycoplasmoides pneumoniae]P75076.1 RecName: Full=UPF0134 protein MPN_038 [Mycoplasmoides pneumoniae M129]AAB95764.1 hypothetical protein MPN_038 [Mycoplasmoides pneumoniae M129]AGC03981.1 hypothetical protein C985_0040 [Mycoplasmoides pneumoniae M129-B7]ALA29913.1 hypothetical protein C897_00205 [Mycoplasmoides pneumoniae PI 1428]ALA30883.1 hypothetical protein B434_01725 [Mycoplasmoides pneumoniae 19294]ALA31321.1 hypothetical protein F536_00205 [Mycoplasm
MFKKRLNKDKINDCYTWEEELPDGSYDMGFHGNLNHMEKGKSGYVTHKQLDKKLEVFKQDLLVELSEKFVTKEEFRAQGKQIKELQIEQKAQGKTLQLILEALQGINKRLDKLESK